MCLLIEIKLTNLPCHDMIMVWDIPQPLRCTKFSPYTTNIIHLPVAPGWPGPPGKPVAPIGPGLPGLPWKPGGPVAPGPPEKPGPPGAPLAPVKIKIMVKVIVKYVYVNG